LLIKPSKKAIKNHQKELGKVIDQMRGQLSEKLIETLNPKIQGWTNYHRHVVSSQVFNDVEHWLWHKTYRWSIRRHNNKGRRWVINKYYCTTKNQQKVFASLGKLLRRHTTTKIKRFIKIQSGRSIYDGDQVYWAKRLTKGYGEITPSKAKGLRRQEGKCLYCHRQFVDGDKMEFHHLKPKKDGGSDNYENLVLLHKHCHDQYHAEILKQRPT
jgi:RNA-directed DNA polymerase